MSKFLDKGKWCLYLDQFAASHVFSASPPADWVDIAALIKRGINAGKFLCPISNEQMIETAGMNKESAIFLDKESRKFSLGWCFFTEADVSASYLISRVRNMPMQKHHFIHDKNDNRMAEFNVYNELGRRNEIFKQMIKEAAEPANIIRTAARDAPRGKKAFREVIIKEIKSYYAQELVKRMFWLGAYVKYTPTTVTLAGLPVPFWADVVCHILVSKHQMTQIEAQAAFWILEKEGIDAIPSLSIRASLEAMIAYKGIIEVSNDQMDILRIAGALPFADIMLIDGSKANDVRELQLNKKFQTDIYSGKKAELKNLRDRLIAISSSH